RPPRAPLFPYTTLCRSDDLLGELAVGVVRAGRLDDQHPLAGQRARDELRGEGGDELLVDLLALLHRVEVAAQPVVGLGELTGHLDRKSTRLNSSHVKSS